MHDHTQPYDHSFPRVTDFFHLLFIISINQTQKKKADAKTSLEISKHLLHFARWWSHHSFAFLRFTCDFSTVRFCFTNFKRRKTDSIPKKMKRKSYLMRLVAANLLACNNHAEATKNVLAKGKEKTKHRLEKEIDKIDANNWCSVYTKINTFIHDYEWDVHNNFSFLWVFTSISQLFGDDFLLFSVVLFFVEFKKKFHCSTYSYVAAFFSLSREKS